LGSLTSDVSILSSLAVILGAIFVGVQIRQTNRMIQVAADQARAAAYQSKLTTQQMEQNNELANMDMVMRLYEFANTNEVQAAWLTVLNSNVNTYDDFLNLPKPDQVAFFQIGALFESIGVLVKRGFVKLDIIEDMFLTQLAWKSLKPFVEGARNRFGEEESYASFEKLHDLLATSDTASATDNLTSRDQLDKKL
jgi:hypothetical protein